jgi:hypothetical protein
VLATIENVCAPYICMGEYYFYYKLSLFDNKVNLRSWLVYIVISCKTSFVDFNVILILNAALILFENNFIQRKKMFKDIKYKNKNKNIRVYYNQY